jgi:hypothetical protein
MTPLKHFEIMEDNENQKPTVTELLSPNTKDDYPTSIIEDPTELLPTKRIAIQARMQRSTSREKYVKSNDVSPVKNRSVKDLLTWDKVVKEKREKTKQEFDKQISDSSRMVFTNKVSKDLVQHTRKNVKVEDRLITKGKQSQARIENMEKQLYGGVRKPTISNKAAKLPIDQKVFERLYSKSNLRARPVTHNNIDKEGDNSPDSKTPPATSNRKLMKAKTNNLVKQDSGLLHDHAISTADTTPAKITRPVSMGRRGTEPDSLEYSLSRSNSKPELRRSPIKRAKSAKPGSIANPVPGVEVVNKNSKFIFPNMDNTRISHTRIPTESDDFLSDNKSFLLGLLNKEQIRENPEFWNNLFSKEELIEKKSDHTKIDQVFLRQSQWLAQKSKKLEVQKLMKEKTELSECSFKPFLISKRVLKEEKEKKVTVPVFSLKIDESCIAENEKLETDLTSIQEELNKHELTESLNGSIKKPDYTIDRSKTDRLSEKDITLQNKIYSYILDNGRCLTEAPL